MPSEGWDEGLALKPKDAPHDNLPRKERCDSATAFWNLVLDSLSHGDLPDAYPFNWEGSIELRDNEEGRNA